MNRVKRVLVTGHDGYVGAALCPRLTAAKYDVFGMDTFYYSECGFGEPTPPVAALRRDVRDVGVEDLRGFDAIVHLAGLSNDPCGELNPDLTLSVNHEATIRLARAARDARVGRFLYASSCSLYGRSHDGWVDERSELAPLTAYAISKARAEAELLTLADDRFAVASLRCATVYGVSPKLRVDLVVQNLAASALITGQVRVMSDGSPWRPLIHVEDLAAAYEAFLAAPTAEINGLCLNVGFDGQNYQVRDVADAVQRQIAGSQVVYANTPDLDSRSYRVRFGRFRDISGVAPRWDLERGVQDIVEAFRRANFTEPDFRGRRYVRLAQLQWLAKSGYLNDQLRWAAHD